MDTGTHYIKYDPDEIWNTMVMTHIAEGGDILYPGDEKEILLRSVQALFVQGFAKVDNALLMDSIRHTSGIYMDIYGSKRSCYRIEAQAAQAEAEIVFTASMVKMTIPAGTALTADGQQIYVTLTDIEQTGFSQTSRVLIAAEAAGSAGNGLTEGTAMQLCAPNPAVISITITRAASGGRDREDDESYRQRIIEYGLVSVTTGPRQQYEQVARAVSTEILDVKAVHAGPCAVCIYLITADNADSEALKAQVLEALSAEDERPLTDYVTVVDAEKLPYVLNVTCTIDSTVSADMLTDVIGEYASWQDNQIKRSFNPDMLMAKLYNAGVTRVQWTDGSNFNGGAVEYTTIGENQCCKGTINLTLIT